MGISGLVVGFAAPFLVALDAQKDSSLFRPNPCPRLHPATTIPSTTRKRELCVLYSQLSQKQIAEDIRKRYLSPLLEEAGIPFDERVAVENLSDLGFANNVFRVTVDQNAALLSHHNIKAAPQEQSQGQLVLVAKIFSDLAKKRVDPHQSFMGEVDEVLYRHGLGPHVLAHTSDAILMEYIDGQVLTESLLFGDNGNTVNEKGLSICSKVGEKLGHMHSLPGKGGPNMLWHAMDVMLSSVDEKQCQLTIDSGSSWSLSKLRDTIGNYRGRLEALDIPCVNVGHGDFKLSNVMITHATQEIQFIDFELSGTHYRGYDLAKFFRSSTQQSASYTGDRSLYQEALWESYCKSTAITKNEGHHDQMSKSDMDKAISQLEWEAQLLEPMTWLEAASFFLSMASLDDPSETEKWNTMAVSRLSSFEKMKLTVKEL